MQSLVFVTGNENKVKEAQAILGFPIEIYSAEFDEIQDLDVEKVVRKKTQTAFEKVQKPLIVDDAGLYVNVWNGFPGSFVKYLKDYAGLDRMQKWLELEDDNSVTVVAAVGYHDGETIHTFRGEVTGKFVRPRGEGGWGFDKYIIPTELDKTWGEVSEEEKNRTSHRRRALEKFSQFLENKERNRV
jgi:XTP/dITP diphosphohydrolase